MSTGISISSINRIKELAEEKKYAEALEILDTQNLDKSINPQFLRISGEIFRENKRYYDSRRILLKSHQMSPQGIRIIFELIKLHLELGHFSIAEKYYEQYMFYSSPEDTQKDYVEYTMKKATGTDIKELAAILIPILERMPEDQWNFEAVLLYDKLGRKDKALEEGQYILENFKDSIYTQPVIEYIDEKLDVDRYFWVYPRQEQEDREDIFGELIAKEATILHEDYLRMYPPEARIMVDVEDKEAIVETKPAKEKKKKRKQQKHPDLIEGDETIAASAKEDGQLSGLEAGVEGQEGAVSKEQQEEELRQEREAALEKLLSKRIDREKIRESAKQVAQAVKDIDTEKAKNQVKSVAESVKDNVKKATDVLGEAVGVSVSQDDIVQLNDENESSRPEEQIMDGIIEEVFEAPKKVVGQVVTNEELDTLIPDSLEAMSEEEIADIEARRREELASAERDEKAALSEDEKEIPGQEDESSFDELKARYFAEQEIDEKPLDSLGFITVVQSDVDKILQDGDPDLANMLHQMIDNKEYYTGENSIGFESEASYQNHGFEVEDYEFGAYKETAGEWSERQSQPDERESDDPFSVEVIYAQEAVVNFNEIVPGAEEEQVDPIVGVKEEQTSSIVGAEEEQAALNAEVKEEQAAPNAEAKEEQASTIAGMKEGQANSIIGMKEEQTQSVAEAIEEMTNPIAEVEEKQMSPIVDAEEERTDPGTETAEKTIDESQMDAEIFSGETGENKDYSEFVSGELIRENDIYEMGQASKRELLRVRIILSDNMVRKLLDLKESRK